MFLPFCCEEDAGTSETSEPELLWIVVEAWRKGGGHHVSSWKRATLLPPPPACSRPPPGSQAVAAFTPVFLTISGL